LEDRFTDTEVETFVVPDYTREDFIDGPRIGVRLGGRELTIDQGVDARNVIIEVGVIGITPEKEGATTSEYRVQVVEACDEFDSLMEEILELWTPYGPLRYEGMAEHSFVTVEQPTQFDAQQLYTSGLWVSLIRLTYQDSLDEDD
jgi:hypothetical protein